MRLKVFCDFFFPFSRKKAKVRGVFVASFFFFKKHGFGGKLIKKKREIKIKKYKN